MCNFLNIFKRHLLIFAEFSEFLYSYLKNKLIVFGIIFEKNKDFLVKFFIIKRGRYNRPFLHLSTMAVLGIGVMISPFLATTYPTFVLSANKSMNDSAPQPINTADNVFKTDVSEKPRSKAISYPVQNGDTISTISDKFGISQNTIRWANDLTDDNLRVGDALRILPVTGVEYKVQNGDTVYSIAKMFDTQAQKIADFPFNDFANPETFSLIAGQMLIVPDGIKPSEQPYIKQEYYFTQGPASKSSAGFFWPIRGLLSQNFSWYHPGIDIATSLNSPVYSAMSGRVVEALIGGWNTGYGNTVVIDNGNGYATRYSHLNDVNVKSGDIVEAGKTIIGGIGVTGRTTGPHLDFRVTLNGVYVNPLPLLQ